MKRAVNKLYKHLEIEIDNVFTSLLLLKAWLLMNHFEIMHPVNVCVSAEEEVRRARRCRVRPRRGGALLGCGRYKGSKLDPLF